MHGLGNSSQTISLTNKTTYVQKPSKCTQYPEYGNTKQTQTIQHKANYSIRQKNCLKRDMSAYMDWHAEVIQLELVRHFAE